MPEQRFNLDGNDELTEPLEPDVDASALPASVFDLSATGSDFSGDDELSPEFQQMLLGRINDGKPRISVDELMDTLGMEKTTDEEIAPPSQSNTDNKLEVTTKSSTEVPKQPLPERIAHLVAAGPPMPVLYAPTSSNSTPVAVEEEEEAEEVVEEETFIEEEMVMAPPVKKLEVEEPRPPLIQNVGLPKYILLSTTVMTVVSLAPLFLPL